MTNLGGSLVCMMLIYLAAFIAACLVVFGVFTGLGWLLGKFIFWIVNKYK